MKILREYIQNAVSKNAVGIEIGPSWAPILPKKEGYKTFIVDHCNEYDLKRICENDDNIKHLSDNIEKVDFIDNGIDFKEMFSCPDGFDFIVSSHNIEHLTNPVSFLIRAQNALRPGGRLYMIVPDRRNTFDYYRPVSTVGQFLEAYNDKRTVHSFSAIYDARTYDVSGNTPDGDITFNRNQDKSLYDNVIENLHCGGYIDAHAWIFTPSSFQHIILSLNNIGVIRQRIVKLTVTSYDFLVVLEPVELPIIHSVEEIEKLASAILMEYLNPRRGKVNISNIDSASDVIDHDTIPLTTDNDNEIPANEQSNIAYVIDERMVDDYPNDELMLSSFPLKWNSALPGFESTTGTLNLFTDSRLHWLFQNYPIRNSCVLELGPLECGHTFMLEKIGNAKVECVEGNKSNFIKCLFAKNIYGLDAKIMLGDILKFVSKCQKRYDLVIASGVLYHMMHPVDFLAAITKITDAIFLWTHYYSPENPSPGVIKAKYEELSYGFEGRSYQLHKSVYDEAVHTKTYCGGIFPFSYWMERNAILDLLASQGYSEITIAHDAPFHPHGASFSLLAHRKR